MPATLYRCVAALAGALVLCPATSAAAASCRGAAALAPESGCASPHQQSVAPHPETAILQPGPPCIRMRARSAPRGSCWFPSSRRRPKPTIALIGDSHAQAWRATVSPLAASYRRRAVSLTMASCPFARADRIYVSEGRMADCYRWIDDVTQWLRRHPAVRTVFFINSSTYRFASTPEQTAYDRGVEGYRAAFEALPPSVKQLVVIRDNPHMTYQTNECVARAMSDRRLPGPTCALARDEALRPDPAAAAAAMLTRPGVQAVDLTKFFCDAERCYPTLGGVLVYKDIQHITRQFGHSLWRYLRAELS